MAESPKVTVLTPTYNRPDYLPEAVRSVVNQEFTDWEMLVINDGGVDVGDVVARVGDERVRYHNRPQNRGKAACLNFGLERARGEYIAYLDDDDIWYPNHLETLAAALDADPGIGAAYSDLYKTIVLPGEDGRRYPVEKRVDVCRDFNRMFMFHFNHTLHVSLMHRKGLALRAGGYNEDVRVLIDWNITRKLCFLCDFRHVQVVTGEYYMPLKDSDRISDVQRRDEERYRQNLRLIRGDLPPEPWPKVEKVAVVLPVGQWNEPALDVVRYLLDKLDYPCRIVLVNRDASRDATDCRRALGELAEPGHIQVVDAPPGADLHRSYLAGARAVDSDYCYLPSLEVNRGKELRLIEGLCFLRERGCPGLRWEYDGDAGRPYDVLLRRSALLDGDGGPGDWCGVRAVPRDWIPKALEVDYLLYFARRCEDEGDFRTAHALLQRASGARAGGTGTPYMVQRLARVAFTLGDYGPAEKLCRELIESGYGAENWVRLGQICQRRGDWREAADAYRNGLRMIGLPDEALEGPPFPLAGEGEFSAFRAMLGLGECRLELGELAQAARALRKASRLRANDPRPWLSFGRLFLEADDLDSADQAFQQALSLGGEEVATEVLTGRAQVCERRGMTDQAHRLWRRALEARPDDSQVLAGVIRTAEAAEDREALAAAYRRFLEYRPGHVPALVALAELCLKLGRAEDAAELAQKATALAPEDERARAVGERARAAVN
ncbi:MAG: glycosyltransferase [Candidatus Brocadiia bacterium]